MPKAKHLRCFKHFEGNCKEKLRKISICSAKDQKKFLNKVFGVYGKEEVILDAEDKKDLKRRLYVCVEGRARKRGKRSAWVGQHIPMQVLDIPRIKLRDDEEKHGCKGSTPGWVERRSWWQTNQIVHKPFRIHESRNVCSEEGCCFK